MVEEEKRYARQVLLEAIGPEGQAKLAGATVVIVGVGALGSVQAQLLARAGVGTIRVVDRDVPETVNLHRQLLFTEEDVRAGIPKAKVAARELKRINSAITVSGEAADLTPRNAERLTAGADCLLDGTDNLETRYLINDVAVKRSVPWIYGGVVGTEGMVMPVFPKDGPCLRCLFPTPPAPGTLPTCETEGVLNAAAATVGALQAAEAFKALVGIRAEPRLLSLDVWSGAYRSVTVCRDEACPCCGKGRFDSLEADAASWATRLCGRNAVQVAAARPAKVPLESLAKRLQKSGTVEFNGYLLRFDTGDRTLLVFPDGRCIVKGTQDEKEARSLVAKYVGC
jgi:adenylyltransferase/sulfurtransferase